MLIAFLPNCEQLLGISGRRPDVRAASFVAAHPAQAARLFLSLETSSSLAMIVLHASALRARVLAADGEPARCFAVGLARRTGARPALRCAKQTRDRRLFTPQTLTGSETARQTIWRRFRCSPYACIARDQVSQEERRRPLSQRSRLACLDLARRRPDLVPALYAAPYRLSHL